MTIITEKKGQFQIQWWKKCGRGCGGLPIEDPVGAAVVTQPRYDSRRSG